MVGDGAGVLSWHHSKEWGGNFNDVTVKNRNRRECFLLSYHDFKSWGGKGGRILSSAPVRVNERSE